MKLEDRDFFRLRDYMKQHFGINLEKKRTLIEGRLSNTIQRKGFADFSSYIDYALDDPDEITLLVSRLSTNYTYFMREEQHYRFLRERVLPEWVPRIKDRDLRIWSAGCSSGEEAYTTAMVLREHLTGEAKNWDTTILATDISENVLGLARKGIYPEEEMRNLPEHYKKLYFKQVEPGLFQIADNLRKQVVFGNLNLMEQKFPFKRRFHVIFCRNVMIYFDNKTREQLAERFYDWLMPGGYMFIGLSETMANLKTRFEYIMPAIYTRNIQS